ncbi:MAG: Ser-Thr-rich GPI-anchored membrane family protein, partial [Thermodesulfobacteriota bacterium]
SKNYTLQNTGGTSINWTASKGQSWVTLSSAGGTLGAGASTTVTVSINSNANSLSAGSYSDTVSFTNTTNNNGNASRGVNLIIIANGISVISPNGGETWPAGSIQTIRWSYTVKLGVYVKVELLKGGVVNRTIAASASSGSGGSGSRNWKIPANQVPGTDYRIRVTNKSTGAYTDTSDNDFTIAPPTITVVSPNSGETWPAGSRQMIRWNYTGNPGAYVKIELLKGGVVNRIIASSAGKGPGGSGSRNWTIPANQAPGTDYTIRVTSTTNGAYTDTSDSDFTIK